jgi:hypothetical protein
MFTRRTRFTHYRQWLGKQKSFLDDLASLDPDLYQGLIFLKHYTGNPEDLSLNFTVAVDGASPVLSVCQPRLTQVLRVRNR